MTKQGGFGKPNSGFATICRFGLANRFGVSGNSDSKRLFYPEQLENEACPNHLHSSRAASVHDHMLWVGLFASAVAAWLKSCH
jgi:hypothetical protein